MELIHNNNRQFLMKAFSTISSPFYPYALLFYKHRRWQASQSFHHFPFLYGNDLNEKQPVMYSTYSWNWTLLIRFEEIIFLVLIIWMCSNNNHSNIISVHQLWSVRYAFIHKVIRLKLMKYRRGKKSVESTSISSALVKHTFRVN